jgi:hypothetical protein
VLFDRAVFVDGDLFDHGGRAWPSSHEDGKMCAMKMNISTKWKARMTAKTADKANFIALKKLWYV